MHIVVIPAQAGIQNSEARPMPKRGYVYILASRRNGTLYTGVTSNLAKRVWEHKRKRHEGFTAQYDVHRPVYYESHDDITREKAIKKWQRQWKLNLIESVNPTWQDLYDGLQY